MSLFDDVLLAAHLRNLERMAKEKGVEIQFEDGQGDIGRQLSQVQNFIAQKVDVIILNPVDTAATPKMTKLVTEAGIPLVYFSQHLRKQQPVNFLRESVTLVLMKARPGPSRQRRWRV